MSAGTPFHGKIVCDVCGTATDNPNRDWVGWGQVIGLRFDSKSDPMLCPECLEAVGWYINRLRRWAKE